jgi:dihydroflavonol-4-reductase
MSEPPERPRGKVLVTGATGFLGSWLVRQLLADGYQVRVLVRARSRHGMLDGRCQRVAGDLLDPTSLPPALAGVDAVIHAAAMISMRPRDREQMYRVNVDGTRHLLAAATAAGVRVLFVSTIGTVGFSAGPVARDESQSPAPDEFEDHSYVQSKHESERLALQASAAGADVVVVNPGLLLGPGDSNDGSTRIVSRFLGGQSPCYAAGGISFADVRDVARACVTALARGRTGQRYLLGAHNRSYRQLLDALSAITGQPPAVPLVPALAAASAVWSETAARIWTHRFEEWNSTTARYSARFNYCRMDKAIRELDYRPRPFDETLRDTVADVLRRRAAGPVGPGSLLTLFDHVSQLAARS